MDALNNKSAAADKIKLRQTALLNKIDSSLKQQWQEQTTADVLWDRPSAEKANGQAMAIVWSLWFRPGSCGFSPRSQFLTTNHLSEHMQGQLLLSKAPSNLNIIHPKDLQLKHPAVDMVIQHSNEEAQMGWSRRQPRPVRVANWWESLPSPQAACRVGQSSGKTPRLPSLNQTQTTADYLILPGDILGTSTTVFGHAPRGTFHAVGKRQPLCVRIFLKTYLQSSRFWMTPCSMIPPSKCG